MRGIGALRRSTDGIGGFTEAVIALMVVTVAVILLSASFSITSIEVLTESDEASLVDGCEDVWNMMVDDELLWDGSSIVLSSFGTRSSDPYGLPDGLLGYEISLMDVSNGSLSSVIIVNGTEVVGAEIRTERHPVLVRTEMGAMHAGLIEVRAW
jgi:hypothetical protein